MIFVDLLKLVIRFIILHCINAQICITPFHYLNSMQKLEGVILCNKRGKKQLIDSLFFWKA